MAATAEISLPISGALPVCLVPENPHGLVSLWDMLRIYATNFVRIGARFERCVSDARVFMHPHEQASAAMMDRFNDLIETIRLDAASMKLDSTLELTEHCAEKSKGGFTFKELADTVEKLHVVYQGEIRQRVFAYISSDRVKYFDQNDLFGPEVARAFHSCSQEIRDAGTCYATDQDTACVMHLMRVLEIGLTVLAKAFGVKSDREQWHNIIENIEKAVNSLGPSSAIPDWKECKEFYSSVCLEFRYFKDAWRNHAMHSRERFNGPAAERILTHVGDFMRQLSQRLSE